MQYKLTHLAVGLAAIFAFSGQAGAAIANPDGITGKLPSSQGTVDSLGGGSWSSFAAGGYTDIYSVSFASLSNFDVTSAAYNGLAAINIHGHAFSASTGSVTETLYSGSTKIGSFTSNSKGVASGTFSRLIGNYTLDISTTLGAGAPRSGYSLTSSVTPVPEPTEGALLLSGIGLLGFIAARRGRKEA